MFKKFLGFLVVLALSSGLFAANFDDVIWSDKIVEEKVEAGFGTTFLLKVVSSNEVSGLFQELTKLGRIVVYVQKLRPQNEGETKTTRVTFEAWRQTGFFQCELVKTLVVDRFSYENIMDASPDYYRIVSNN